MHLLRHGWHGWHGFKYKRTVLSASSVP